MKQLTLGALLAAVAMFVWGALVWTVPVTYDLGAWTAAGFVLAAFVKPPVASAPSEAVPRAAAV